MHHLCSLHLVRETVGTTLCIAISLEKRLSCHRLLIEVHVIGVHRYFLMGFACSADFRWPLIGQAVNKKFSPLDRTSPEVHTTLIREIPMLTSFTDRQHELIGPTIRKALRTMRCTFPTDHAMAEEGARMLYHSQGMVAPDFVWYASPMHLAGEMGEGLANLADSFSGFLQDPKWTRYGEGEDLFRFVLSEPLWNWLAGTIHTGLQCSAMWCPDDWSHWLYSGASTLVGWSPENSARMKGYHLVLDDSNVLSQLREALSTSLKSEGLADTLTFANRGQFNPAFALYDAIGSICEIPWPEHLRVQMIIAESCSLWWPLEDRVLLCERPTLMHLDSEGALHCADGPALQFSDGFSVFSWHGLTVSRQLIEQPETIADEQIKREKNSRMRKLMQMRRQHNLTREHVITPSDDITYLRNQLSP
jgi:hypothetical protein